jgi:hypothetical protein
MQVFALQMLGQARAVGSIRGRRLLAKENGR